MTNLVKTLLVALVFVAAALMIAPSTARAGKKPAPGASIAAPPAAGFSVTTPPGMSSGAIVTSSNSRVTPAYASAVTVPEPASLLLLGTGLIGAATAVRRKLKGRKQE